MAFCLLAGWRDIADLLSAFVIFILVLFVAFYVTRFVGTYEKQKQLGKNVTVLETCRIGAGRYIQLIKVAERVLVIAVSRDRVVMLSEIPASELDFKEEGSPDKTSPFQSVLEKARKKLVIPKSEVWVSRKNNNRGDSEKGKNGS